MLAVAAVWLWLGFNASSATAATGDLTLQECIEDNDQSTEAACADTNGLFGARGVAVSPDGTSVYVVAQNEDAIVNFSRNTSTGALTFSQCFDDDVGNSEGATCAGATGLNGATGVAVSADGTSVYVASNQDDAVVTFNRNTGTGALTNAGCFEDTGAGTSCTDTGGLNGASGVAVSPNGASVYVTSNVDDAIVNFNRNTGTGALTASQCFDDPGNDAGCTDTNPLGGALGVAVSPNGASVYVAASLDDVVVNFNRNTGTGALTFSQCFDDPGQEAACTDTAGMGGASGVAASADGASVYAASSDEVGGNGDDDAVVNFNRNTGTGALTFSQCFDDPGNDAGCTDTPGLDGATAVAVSSENGSEESVYVAAGTDSAIVNLDRNATTGALSGAVCYEDAGQPGGQQDCANPDPAGLAGVVGVAATSDGKSVYSAAVDDDAVDNFNREGQPAISINDVTQAEGNSGDTAFNFTVSLNRASAQTVTVAYSTADGTATLADSDYDSASGTVTFVPGDVSETVTVNVNGDTTDETNENFNVNLSSPTKASIADGQGVGTITNDDDPQISINDVSVTEGDSGETDATFTVSLNHASLDTVTVDWATANGTATVADGDYDSNSGTVTFAPGDTSETVTVKVNGDNKDEPNETFNVNLSNNSSNSSILDGTGVGTITDDDPAPTISINDISVTEGNVGTTNANFTVSLSNPSSQTVTVDFDTSDGTATDAGNDYEPHSETVSFAPGDTSKQVTVLVNGDLIDEPDETFNGDLSNASNGTIGDNLGVATITDDDGAPTVSVNDVSEAEGDSGTTDFDFTVSLSNPSAAPITVDFDTSDGTATDADNDYEPHSETVTFLPLETQKTVTVTVNGDTTDEDDEDFNVDLSNVSATATIGDGHGEGTITNDDDPAISISDPTVTEGNSGTTNANFDVTLNHESNETVTVDFDTSDGTATDADNDYEPHSETVTFTGSSTSETVSVPVNGDTADEADEVFHGDLSNATNATIADNQGDATITNDDDPQISIDDVSQAEGDSGPTSFVFTVSLDRPSNEDVTVDFDTADGTATTADDDYESESGTVTFTGGSTSETVSVDVNGDTKDESDETFTVDLSNASAASISDGQGQGTIQNDDPDPAISIGDVSDTEGNTGQKDFDFEVTLSNASDQTITVDYATANGTATTGDGDYDSKSGTVTFSPGDVSETVTVKVNGDDKDESDETFTVDLSNASSNSSILDNQGVGTIENDDPDPAISIGDVTDTEGDSGEKDFDFAVTLSNPSDQQITVDFDTSDGTATTADGDYDAGSGTVTFAAGDTSETVTVKVNGDTKDESDETFDVELDNATNATIADGTGTGTITNDDADPAISIGDVSATEGDSGEKDFDFAVTLSNPSDQQITVDFATADDSATTADSDYDADSGTVTFNPGDTSETVTVKVNGDTTDEPDETFDVVLSNNSTNSTIADDTGVGTIQNDDDPQVSIDDVTETEGDSGETDFVFTVSLDQASAEDVTVAYSTSNGTATTGDGDYDSQSGTVTFTGGSTSETVTVKVNGDTRDEADETFDVDLSSPTNATIADDTGVGTITDDDDPPVLSIGDVTDTEGDSGEKDFDFEVVLDEPSGKTVTVDFASEDGAGVGSATVADGDYDSNSGTLTFSPGDTSETATVKVNGDDKFEQDEDFGVGLSDESNATIDDDTGQGTITNDDDEPTISINDVAQDEGDTSSTGFGFTVSLSNPSDQQITVDYATLNGTATTGDGDYQAASGTAIFAPGDTSETATVQVNGDTKDEPNEEFDVDLSNESSNSSVADPTGTGTIQNDDPDPSVSIADVSLMEGNSGATPFGFLVTLSNPSSQTVTVRFDTANGTATEPSDYNQVNNQLVTFAAGDTSEQVTVNVNGDTSNEADESFNANLTNPTNSSIADAQGLGTILNDDAPPVTNPPVAGGPADAAPDTTITQGPKPKSKKKTATFTFSGTDARAVASFECKVDGGGFQPCTSPMTVKVKKGTHTFQVRAVDTAGNVDPTPATQSWTVKKKKKK